MNSLVIYFDGGCKPTNPGNKYGSYEATLNGETIVFGSRVEFGWGTNNQAEFDALIECLRRVTLELVDAEIDTSNVALTIYTDSMIVRNRVSGRTWKNKYSGSETMGKLAAEVVNMIRMFGKFSIEWKRRTENVARFGH